MKKDENITIFNNIDRLGRTIETLEADREQFNLLKEVFLIVYNAIESTMNGIIITASDSRIQYVNPAFMKMFGYSEEKNIIGKKLETFFSNEEINSYSDVTTLIDINEGQKQEFDVIRKDGMEFIIEATYSAVLNMEGAVIGTMISFVDISPRKKAEKEMNILIEKLQKALAKVKQLQGFIPICASCKKIRNDEGFWQQVEVYIRDHSEAQFSHGLCPECASRLYPEFTE